MLLPLTTTSVAGHRRPAPGVELQRRPPAASCRSWRRGSRGPGRRPFPCRGTPRRPARLSPTTATGASTCHFSWPCCQTQLRARLGQLVLARRHGEVGVLLLFLLVLGLQLLPLLVEDLLHRRRGSSSLPSSVTRLRSTQTRRPRRRRCRPCRPRRSASLPGGPACRARGSCQSGRPLSARRQCRIGAVGLVHAVAEDELAVGDGRRADVGSFRYGVVLVQATRCLAVGVGVEAVEGRRR